MPSKRVLSDRIFEGGTYVLDSNGELRKVARLENTDGDPGDTIFIGATEPPPTLVEGDIWEPGTGGGGSGTSSGPRGELAYAQTTTSQTGISALVDVTGLSITFDVIDRPVMVEAYIPWMTASANQITGGLHISDAANTSTAIAAIPVPTASSLGSAIVFERITAPGTYTRKVRVNRASGTGTVGILVDLATVIAHIRAIEV